MSSFTVFFSCANCIIPTYCLTDLVDQVPCYLMSIIPVRQSFPFGIFEFCQGSNDVMD